MKIDCVLTACNEINDDNDFISGEKIQGLCDVSVYSSDVLQKFPNLKLYCNKLIVIKDDLTETDIEIINSSNTFFVKTDYLSFFVNKILPRILKEFIIVTHNSDYTVGGHESNSLLDDMSAKILRNKLLLKWFGQNMIPNEKSQGIPIGLENTSYKGCDYEICLKNKFNSKTNLYYFNFSIHTNKNRPMYKQQLIDNGFDYTDGKVKWDDYINILSRSKFCFSPPGNGVDCHRHWECIYVGCIPVVLKNDILFVDSYDQVTPQFLEDKYTEISGKCYDFRTTKLSHYNTEIKRLITTDRV